MAALMQRPGLGAGLARKAAPAAPRLAPVLRAFSGAPRMPGQVSREGSLRIFLSPPRADEVPCSTRRRLPVPG
jgi:hypothetical protein